jgi:23S rRNA (pseudouridine1915-N3)-methyltransferase
MKIRLWVVGKTTRDFVAHGLDEFCERIRRYVPFEMEVIPDLRNTKNLSTEQVKEKEGEGLLKRIGTEDFVVLLDERGREFSSLHFAEYLGRKMQVVPKSLVFIIGGPYGFSNRVREAAQETIALSKMTFPHQLVRLIFAEQLYRALTILHGEPYHHE